MDISYRFSNAKSYHFPYGDYIKKIVSWKKFKKIFSLKVKNIPLQNTVLWNWFIFYFIFAWKKVLNNIAKTITGFFNCLSQLLIFSVSSLFFSFFFFCWHLFLFESLNMSMAHVKSIGQKNCFSLATERSFWTHPHHRMVNWNFNLKKWKEWKRRGN